MVIANDNLRKILESLSEEEIRLRHDQHDWGGPGTLGHAFVSELLRKSEAERAEAKHSGMRSLARWNNAIALVAAIFAAIAAWPVMRGCFQPAPISDKSATDPPQQSQSTESSPTKAKTSASSIHPSKPPESVTKNR
jgi:hypothetical protein